VYVVLLFFLSIKKMFWMVLVLIQTHSAQPSRWKNVALNSEFSYKGTYDSQKCYLNLVLVIVTYDA